MAGMGGQMKFLDLFAGGGGLSEGFIQAGFTPVAHVEADQAACHTLRTRRAYHWLKAAGKAEIYAAYLNGALDRAEFYQQVPAEVVGSVVNAEIGRATIKQIFRQVDLLLDGQRLDLIVGGPPCQAYSLVGRSCDQNRMRGDKRSRLYAYYAEFLKRYRPSYFVFENVPGLLSAKDGRGGLIFSAMQALFRKCGYQTEYQTLSAEEYGVLQKRRRVILVGRRGNATGFYPQPDKWNPGVKVSEALRGLPALGAGEGAAAPCRVGAYRGAWQDKAGVRSPEMPVTWHQARPHTKRDLEIYRMAVSLWNRKKARLAYNSLPRRLQTHRRRDSFLDRFKVVAADLPYCHTVVAHIAKDGHYYIHPDARQNRSLTPREAARLQTFPDDYHFEGVGEAGSRTAAFHQIGNAVPVLLARKVADKLREVWF